MTEELENTLKNRIFACSKNGKGIRYSDNDGKSWVFSNITEGSFAKPIRYKDLLIVRCVNAGDKGILYSKNAGKSWFPSNLPTGYYGEIEMLPDGSLITTSRSESDPDGTTFTSNSGSSWKKRVTLVSTHEFVRGSDLQIFDGRRKLAELTEKYGDIDELLSSMISRIEALESALSNKVDSDTKSEESVETTEE